MLFFFGSVYIFLSISDLDNLTTMCIGIDFFTLLMTGVHWASSICGFLPNTLGSLGHYNCFSLFLWDSSYKYVSHFRCLIIHCVLLSFLNPLVFVCFLMDSSFARTSSSLISCFFPRISTHVFSSHT